MELNLFTSLLGFALCSALIFYSGKKLSFYGDLISELTGMGKAWVGLIMMASVTSLPELTVGASSVYFIGSADLALGDVMGSCAFNLGLLSLLDAFYPKHPIFSRVSQGQVLSGAMGIILIALVGLGIYLPGDYILIGWVGLSSMIFLIVYLIAIRVLFKFEYKNGSSAPAMEYKDNHSLKGVIRNYVLHASLVIAAAVLVPYFAEGIAKATGLGESFVGTLFLAASTSFPEIAVSLAALRLGSVDMAVGNLLGSNIFNIFILAICDVFYVEGNILKDASDVNLISVFAAIIMTAVAIAGLTFRSENKRFILAWDTLVIFLLYVSALILVFRFGSS
jgi:cation:H+ antiporter